MMTIFDVLADPTRRKILDLLLERPHLVGELVQALGISQPGVSKQLRLLREAGLVQVRRDAQRRWYVLQTGPLQELDVWLDRYRKSWSERYEKLDDYLKKLQMEENEDDSK